MAKNEIKVAVVVDPSGAAKGVKSVSGELDKLGSSAQGTGSKLSSKLGSAFSDITGKGGLATKTLGTMSGGLGGMTVPLLAAGGALTKFALDGAAKFGELGEKVETFKGISGTTAEVASKWTAVADDFGVSADELAGGFGKLGKTLGANAKALDEYGVSVIRAKDGSVDLNATALNVIDTYNKTVDPTIKAKLATEAFGKSYTTLIPLIDEGTQNILDRMKQVDGAQLFTDKKLEEAKKYRLAMDDLHDTIGDLQMNLGEKLIPTIVTFSKEVSFAADKLTWLGDHIPTQVFASFEATLNPIVAGFKGVTKASDDLENSFLHDEGRTSFDNWLVKNSGFLPSFAGGVDVTVDSVAVMGRTSTTAAQNLETLYMAQLDAKGGAEKLTVAQDANAGASKDVVAAYKEQQNALKNLQDAQAGTTDAALASQQADLSAADAIDKYTESLKVNHDKVKDNDQTQRELQQTFLDTQQSIFDTAGTYGDYVVGQEKGAGRIVTATQETTVRNQAQIAKLGELQATVAPGSPLWDAIQQYIDHLKAIPTSVYTNVDTNISGNAAGPRKPGAHSAMGGPVPGGMPRIIGELGPEVFVPESAGYIIPNNRLGSMGAGGASGGGGGNTYYINVTVPLGASKGAVGQEILEALAANERQSGGLKRLLGV